MVRPLDQFLEVPTLFSMSAEALPEEYRIADFFSHIDMGFLNRRLAITALGAKRQCFIDQQRSSDDHMTRLSNDHHLVAMLIGTCTTNEVPTLADALAIGEPRHLFMSTERLEACPEIYDAERVEHEVRLEFDYGKPVVITYHTNHIVSDTGRMVLARGYKEGHRQVIIGCLHNKEARFEIEPIVIGAPWLDDPQNNFGWLAYDYGEILPEDIKEFSAMKEVQAASAEEWMSVMERLPENRVKEAIARLLKEPAKADWGGEENDHFSSNVTVAGKRRTAAFLLKGPTKFREMTPAMCGKNGDQMNRLVNSGADISVVQHAHLIGSAVRDTVRAFVVRPGGRPRKFCIMDGQATYRLLKAYSLLPNL